MHNIYNSCGRFFFVGGLFFCFLLLVFCPQKLFTIASCTVTSEPQKAHK